LPEDPRHQQVLGQLEAYTHQKEEYLGGKNVDRPVKIVPEQQQSTQKELPASRDSSPAQDHKNNEHSDSKQTRQRGQRRRGRKDTSSLDSTGELEGQATAKTPPVDENIKTKQKANMLLSENTSTFPREPKRRSIKRQGDPRYCVGRRPVTDFEIGSTHKGIVVYTKPFGIFIDIGCHSDAFCHVSRLSDDFVENPEDVFKPGDSIAGVRVVETDRIKKRITVSLQSEKRIDDERKSLESRLERKRKRRASQPVQRSQGGVVDKKPKNRLATQEPRHDDHPITRREGGDNSHASSSHRSFQSPADEWTNADPDSQLKDYKRQQKLERRAARRQRWQMDG
jgi:predicted RNA-binding protein with RPS1 domain